VRVDIEQLATLQGNIAEVRLLRPSVYWSPTDLEASVKSRGVPRSVIGTAAFRFHEVFDDLLCKLRQPEAAKLILGERLIPSVPIQFGFSMGALQ
jgi:hypothetical protein